MRLLTSTPDAGWLPLGGRADVVLAEHGDPVPEAVGLVRLLVTRRGRLFAVARTGGRPGLDLPTRPVPAGEAADAVTARLVQEVLGPGRRPTLLGYIRNVVPAGTVYAWPAPVAHFCVHHVATEAEPAVAGAWLDGAAAAAELAGRHWWPLVQALPEGSRQAVAPRSDATSSTSKPAAFSR
ncbi:NUDIX hydrolase [Cellulomonas sp. NPDC057328]|uniref:NUDIX hydrolase n=1 Tax=Cellulomonas sp. NPDC057328 TaxID=3346101 RepID=UPI00362798D4